MLTQLRVVAMIRRLSHPTSAHSQTPFFMVADSSHLFALLVLLTVSGCANSKQAAREASLELPPATEDAPQHLLSPERYPTNGSAFAVTRPLSNYQPPAELFAENSVQQVAYDEGISRWANETTPWPYGESTYSLYASAGRGDARNSRIGVPRVSIATPPRVEKSSADSLTMLPPVEPLDKDITYIDLLSNQAKGIVSDYRQFYSIEGLAWLAGGLGAGALMANTAFDEHFLRDVYMENVVLAPTHEYYEKLHQPKFLGDGKYTIPAFAIAALAEPLIDDLPLGSATAEWGQRSLRTILVGAPPMLGLQLLTGASRPGETTSNSHWKPFQDNNGVSGHSFMGAIPFMSAAKMTDNFWLKAGLYAVSAMPALSRVNDDNHYFSQAFLGWWIAYVAASAVDRSHDPDANHHVFVYPQSGGVGLGFEYRR